MTIRDLREADAAAWWQLRLEALETEPFAFGKSADAHRATPIAEIAARFRDASADARTAGAFAADSLVAIATFKRETGAKDRHKGGLYGVYVAPSHRRAGVARALLHHLIDGARQDASLEQLLVSVGSTQVAARALYRDLGFTTYGTEPRALKIGTTYIDEDHMILRLHDAHEAR